MGADIHGWVEVRSQWLDDDENWWGLIDAGLLLDRNYEAFSRLFGVRNADNAVALAPHRGFPTLVSSQVRQEVESTTGGKLVQRIDGEHGFHSATWAGYEELQTVDWSPFNHSFQTLWQLIEVLAQCSEFNDIRLVVWFDS